MSDKKRVPPQFEGEEKDTVEILMGGGRTHKSTTERPRSTHRRATKGPQKGPLEIYKIRLHPRDYEALKRHFALKGMKVTTGIRSVIMEYMERKGI